MTAGALGLLIPLLSGAIALLKWWSNYFSDSSVLRRLQLALERQKARMEVEAERLLRAYERIDSEAAKTGPDLVDALNEKFKGVRRPRTSLAAHLWALQWRQVRGWIGLGLVLLLLGASCARFHPEPALDFPPWPRLTFQPRLGGGACLDEPDAQELLRWLDKIRAFDAARQRLLQ